MSYEHLYADDAIYNVPSEFTQKLFAQKDAMFQDQKIKVTHIPGGSCRFHDLWSKL